MGKNVFFEKAGKVKDNERVFLMSNNRKYTKNGAIYHRNDFHTKITIPTKEFRKYFKYETSSGIYRNGLTWGELKKIASIETFGL